MPRGEAVHYRERALQFGVPDSAVLLEPRATNTGENIEFAKAVLTEAGVTVSSVLLVSKPYEERRSYAMMRKLWPSSRPCRIPSWPRTSVYAARGSRVDSSRTRRNAPDGTRSAREVASAFCGHPPARFIHLYHAESVNALVNGPWLAGLWAVLKAEGLRLSRSPYGDGDVRQDPQRGDGKNRTFDQPGSSPRLGGDLLGAPAFRTWVVPPSACRSPGDQERHGDPAVQLAQLISQLI